jgi:hypothetical protein
MGVVARGAGDTTSGVLTAGGSRTVGSIATTGRGLSAASRKAGRAWAVIASPLARAFGAEAPDRNADGVINGISLTVTENAGSSGARANEVFTLYHASAA